jgi:tRNA nucleotidyltransferase (CCA-adding enzyme)
VTRRLHEAGYAGVVVGGAVRDVLCGLEAGDWDVATSATPDEVQELFERTIPTGVQHGTVTVLSGNRREREAVEVTTFRGEGHYEDGRRPTEVHFLRDLEEDLARRDLTINAFAWDPTAEVFTDAFGGLEDLRFKLIRAVGNPSERFQEDGLRAIRALRFAASLGFCLHPETQGAIAGALEVFDQVSRERVRVELLKLLQASRPSVALTPMVETGLWERVLGPAAHGPRLQSIAAVDRLPPDPVLRLARLMWPLANSPEGDEQVVGVLDRLRPSREERARVVALTGHEAHRFLAAEGPVAIRRAAAALGRRHVTDVLDLGHSGALRRTEVQAALRDAPLSTKELAIKGKQLIDAGIVERGPGVGQLQASLLAWVLEDPSRNTSEALLEYAARST